jgi:voltage-gated potassium channel
MSERRVAGEDAAEEKPTWFERLRERLRLLYHGHAPGAVRFQRAVLLIDLVIIVFFIASPLLRDEPSFLLVDYSVALLLGADVAARALASTHPWRWLRQPTSVVDVFVLVTLLLPQDPAAVDAVA